MTRDYAKQKSALRQGYPSHVRAPSPWTFLTAGLVLGLFISCLLYLQFSYMHHNEDHEGEIAANLMVSQADTPTATEAASTATPKKVHKKAAVAEEKLAEAKKQPRFDFYTLLPSMDVDSAEMAEMNKGHDESMLAPSEVKHPLSYIIQAGSFKEFEEADTLKALLSLQGFDTAHIQTIKTADGDSRFRVFLGPYAKEDEVSSQKAMLAQFNINDALVLKAELKP